jgi:hypothetical protein
MKIRLHNKLVKVSKINKMTILTLLLPSPRHVSIYLLSSSVYMNIYMVMKLQHAHPAVLHFRRHPTVQLLQPIDSISNTSLTQYIQIKIGSYAHIYNALNRVLKRFFLYFIYSIPQPTDRSHACTSISLTTPI